MESGSSSNGKGIGDPPSTPPLPGEAPVAYDDCLKQKLDILASAADDGLLRVDVNGRLICTCPSCNKIFLEKSETILGGDGFKPVELEGGVTFPLEQLEELRLTLESFMKPEILQAILEVYKVLYKEPQYTKMFSWFVRESQFGAECRFAVQALDRFKKNRLDGLEAALEKALAAVKELRGTKHEG